MKYRRNKILKNNFFATIAFELCSVLVLFYHSRIFFMLYINEKLWKKVRIFLGFFSFPVFDDGGPYHYRNQNIDLLCKSMVWLIYDKKLCHRRFKFTRGVGFISRYRINTEYALWLSTEAFVHTCSMYKLLKKILQN